MFSDGENRVLAYAISDRKALGGESLPSFAERAAAAGIDLFQVREKDLSDRALFTLVSECVQRTLQYRMRILVNDRLDIAVAAGAHGVHLGGHSAGADTVRAAAPAEFIIGVSTHNSYEVNSAASAGANFITFGPIFPTASKAKYGPPVGLGALQHILASNSPPVFPLGGIDENNLSDVVALPVQGVAAISLFQNAANLATIVEMIHDG